MERKRSNGMKYELTTELKKHIQTMRREINFSSEQMAELLEMNINTYNNIEKLSGSKTITVEILDKIFTIYKDNIGWQTIEFGKFIIMHLDKYLYTPNTMIKELNGQEWLKAYYLKYQTITISEALQRRIIGYADQSALHSAWTDILKILNKNRHIKVKTKIVYSGEVYTDLDKEKYPDWGGYPFWCIKYDLSDTEIYEMASLIIDKKEIRYSTLFSLLVSLELEERAKKEYNQAYRIVYEDMQDYKNIFDIIKGVQENYGKSDFSNPLAQKNIVDNSDFFKTIQEFENANLSPNILRFIRNCINGGEKFINSINCDFSPLFGVSDYEIEVFRTTLQEYINMKN